MNTSKRFDNGRLLGYRLSMALAKLVSTFRENKAAYLIFLAAIFLRVYHLNLEILEPYNNVARQAIVASVARNFYQHGFNFLRPELDENGDGPSLYNAEMPIHSYLMAIGYQLTGGVKPWAARAVPVIFSIGTLFFLYQLGRRFYGKAGGLGTLLFASLSPLNLALSRALQPESLMLFGSVGTFYFYFLYEDSARLRFFLLSALCLFLAIASKAYNVYLFLPLAYLLWSRRGWGIFKDPRNYLVAAIAGSAFLWYLYAWDVSLRQELYHVPFKYSQRGPAGMTTIELLFSWPHLRVCAKIFLIHLLTPIGAVLFFAGLMPRPKNREVIFLWIWLGSVVVVMIAIWRIVIEHSYYQLPFVPVCALFIGKATEQLASGASTPLRCLKKPPVLALAILLEVVSLLYFYRGLYSIPPRRLAILEAGKATQKFSPPGTLVVASFETSSAQLYYCNRKGWGFDVVTEKDDALIVRLEKYRARGATLFVATSLEDLDKVPRFMEYLRKNYRLVEKKSGYLIFDLR